MLSLLILVKTWRSYALSILLGQLQLSSALQLTVIFKLRLAAARRCNYLVEWAHKIWSLLKTFMSNSAGLHLTQQKQRSMQSSGPSLSDQALLSRLQLISIIIYLVDQWFGKHLQVANHEPRKGLVVALFVDESVNGAFPAYPSVAKKFVSKLF